MIPCSGTLFHVNAISPALASKNKARKCVAALVVSQTDWPFSAFDKECQVSRQENRNAIKTRKIKKLLHQNPHSLLSLSLSLPPSNLQTFLGQALSVVTQSSGKRRGHFLGANMLHLTLPRNPTSQEPQLTKFIKKHLAPRP